MDSMKISVRAPSLLHLAMWQPIETAPKDGTPIWACTHADLGERDPGSRFAESWAGRQITIKHEGKTPSGYDRGWVVNAPVGFGGMPDSWFSGWMPLPSPPSSDERQAPAHGTAREP